MTALPRMPCHVNQGNALGTTLRPSHSCGGSRACNCNHGLFAWLGRYACGRFVKAFRRLSRRFTYATITEVIGVAGEPQ